ncbi:hypothetical protein [Plantactinospora sp. CA-290183]|uniref:hypothetical protein n=1 Tax=Plantactinospora sp. CA-290183 TaxID=3240006 RepID=UPI003D933E57
MRLVTYLYTALAVRLAELRRDDQRDRGDSPVPTAVIIVGLAAAAVALTIAVSQSVSAWMGDLPVPGAPGTGGEPE